MSTINMVKYFFYKNHLPRSSPRLQGLVALAYQTARDRRLHPKSILIRSEVHDTTSVQGKHQKDPLGWHVTLCYKDEEQMAKGTHIACNGYVKGKDNLEFVQVTHAEEKVDSWEKSNGKVVWPFEEDLEIAPEIGYGHFPEDHKN